MKSITSKLKVVWQVLYRLYAVRKHVKLGQRVHLGIGTILWAPNRLEVGHDVYIGKNCTIEVDGSIGNYVLLANQVGLIGRWDHDFRAVGFPMRYAPWIGDAQYNSNGKQNTIVIEDDVWVGFGAIILSDVRIGRGAIVAAGSVVSKSVEPYTIVAGVPAQLSGFRFSVEEIIQHELRLYPPQQRISSETLNLYGKITA